MPPIRPQTSPVSPPDIFVEPVVVVQPLPEYARDDPNDVSDTPMGQNISGGGIITVPLHSLFDLVGNVRGGGIGNRAGQGPRQERLQNEEELQVAAEQAILASQQAEADLAAQVRSRPPTLWFSC